MALREDQILRYSRQILLREVGGRGQTKLLTGAVQVEGSSPALDVALTYLAISGTPVARREGPVPSGFAVNVPLEALSPDAVAGAEAQLVGWVGSSTDAATVEVSRFRVGLTADGLIAAPAGLAWPVEQRLTAESAAAEPDAVTLGALVALVVQRFVLGLESSAVKLSWRDGRWARE
jgi:hypothetical protein